MPCKEVGSWGFREAMLGRLGFRGSHVKRLGLRAYGESAGEGGEE